MSTPNPPRPTLRAIRSTPEGRWRGEQEVQRRAEALRRLGFSATVATPRFDGVARTVAETLDVPIAMVLIDTGEGEQVRGAFGTPLERISRAASLCGAVFAHEGVLVVEDAQRDPRFQEHAFVTAREGVRFLAGAPVVSAEGVALGAVVALDVEPRYFGVREMSTLEALARAVSQELELYGVRLELKAQRQAQRAQAAVLDGLLASIPDAVVMTDAAGRVALLNEPAEGLLPGYEGRGASIRPLLAHEHDLASRARAVLEAEAPLSQALARTTRGGAVAGRKLSLSPAAESQAPPSVVYAHPLLGPSGQVEGSIAIVRVGAQPAQARPRATAAPAVAAEHASSALAVLDPGGEIVWANAAFERLTGPRREAAVGARVGALLNEGEEVEEAVQARRAWEGERTVWDAQGAAVRVCAIVTPLGSASVGDQASEMTVLELIDLRDRAGWAENPDAARKRLGLADRLKSEFLANVGFEIRTPLTSLLGFSELLRADLGREEATPERLEFLRIIGTSGQQLLDRLEDLQDLALLEHDELDADVQVRDVRGLVRAALEAHRSRAEMRGLRLEAEMPQEPLGAAVEAEALSRVVHTLVSNGLRHTEEGGVIVRLSREQREVVIRVQDTGRGIAPAALMRLRADLAAEDSVARPAGGIGLRLAVAKRLAALLGGRIEVDSEEGAGTAFTLRLPAAAVPLAEERAKPRILVADDRPEARAAAIEAIGADGEVEEAETVLEALHCATAVRYDAILLDLDLGGREAGGSVLRALRQRPGYAQTPIVAMTARLFPSDREALRAQGFTAALAKPLAKDALQEVLSEVLGRPERP